MKRTVLILSLSFLFLSSAGSASDLLPDESRKLSSEYLQYDSNRVYSDGTVNWSYDYTFVLTQRQNKVFPAPAEIHEEKKPFMITIKMSSPEVEKKEVKEVKETVKRESVIVYFPFNRAYLVRDQKAKLLSTVRKLKSEYGSNSTITARVTGSACPIGSERYNRTLSVRRAKAVARILEKEGIEVAEVKGTGEIRESGVLCLNRRAVVTFEIKPGKTDGFSKSVSEEKKFLHGTDSATTRTEHPRYSPPAGKKEFFQGTHPVTGVQFEKLNK